jgi:hypothetical protein
LFSSHVETLWVKQGAAVMISENTELKLHGGINALARRWPVTNHVPQADNAINVLLGNVL